MLILHAAPLLAAAAEPACYLWAETTEPAPRARPSKRIPPLHPFSASASAIWDALRTLPDFPDFNTVAPPSVLTVQLPSARNAPLPSPTLAHVQLSDEAQAAQWGAWRVNANLFAPQYALAFFAALPYQLDAPGLALGDDARYWSLAAKFALELLARQRYLPTLSSDENGYRACWMPSLDDARDQQRFALLLKAMPPLARAAMPSDTPPRTLLLQFLGALIDAAVRDWGNQRLRAARTANVESKWLAALVSDDPYVEAKPAELESFRESLETWQQSLRVVGDATYRVCFRLEPPASSPTLSDSRTGEGAGSPPLRSGRGVSAGGYDWLLTFHLQPTDDLSLLVPAEQVWAEHGSVLRFVKRKFENAQERLLAALGYAARLFPPVERALRERAPTALALNAQEAYQFLREAALLLETSGFGVLMPPWWLSRKAGLGLRAKLSGTKQSNTQVAKGILNLNALVNFEWQVSLGGETLTRAEFERLAELKQPLVQIRGQWVELRPEEIEAAMHFWQKQAEQTTLREALQIALGADGQRQGLPIGEVVADGWINDFLSQLRDGEKLAVLPQPESFNGQLRPYQLKGFAWLAFMRRWGLGACLADDMGLGKCVGADTLLFVNGQLETAEQLWAQKATDIQSDGEGDWSLPRQPLIVNALDAHGKIVQAPIRRLYRQRIHERVRRVTLADGSQITLTLQHKLLTPSGWTRDIQAGDYVSVPARLRWQGEAGDADLAKFLAWQMAAGCEPAGFASLVIRQKDDAVLRELQTIVLRLAERYGFNADQPSVRTPAQRSAELRITSIGYRRWLEAKGYCWGKRSRQKVIPAFIMQADDDTIRVFLRNYFDAAGDVSACMRSVEISSASPYLMQQLATLLRRFGIWMRLSSEQKRAMNGAGIFHSDTVGVIGGHSARRYFQEIGFGASDKQTLLEAICKRECNTNVEGEPASNLAADWVATTGLPLRHLGLYNTVYTGGAQPFSRKSLAPVAEALDHVLSAQQERADRALPRSPWSARTLARDAHLDGAVVKQRRDESLRLPTREVFDCEIKAVADVDYDGWVYDFEIAEHHNFVANQFLCHNTIQMIALLLHQPASQPTLLICPTSVVGNWQREVEKFAPQLRVLVHHGLTRKRDNEFARQANAHDLVISSYGLVLRDEKILSQVEWANVVLDEAQNIKNPSAKQTQAARKIPATHRIALTGTPVENRLAELWSIMEFLNPGYLGSQQSFRDHFAKPIERFQDPDATERLKALVQPFILRRLKTDSRVIQDLPDKLEMKVFCNLTKEQATLYQAVVKDTMRQIDEADGIQRRGLVLAMLMKLKQVCNHPTQFLGDQSALPNRSGKLARLGEMLEEVVAANDRALIFTQFAEMGELLKAHLQATFGGEALFLHGGTPQKMRDKMVARFQQPTGGPHIFILSLKAGGTGLNLTRANHVFHFDRWWNPAVENQATDRAFRIGQTRNVQVHKFVCIGTMEEKIDALIESKVALAANVLGTGEAWLTELTSDELRDIFSLRREAVAE